MKDQIWRAAPIVATIGILVVGLLRLAGIAWGQQDTCPPSVYVPPCPAFQCSFHVGKSFTCCSTRPNRCCQYVCTQLSCNGTSQSCWGQLMDRQLVEQYFGGPGSVYRCEDPPGVCTIHFPARPR